MKQWSFILQLSYGILQNSCAVFTWLKTVAIYCYDVDNMYTNIVNLLTPIGWCGYYLSCSIKYGNSVV